MQLTRRPKFVGLLLGCVAGVLAVGGVGDDASALVVTGGVTGRENNSAPPGLTAAWNATGANGGASGVYLGDRWVLSVFHVGAGTLSLPGRSGIAPVAGSTIRLLDPITRAPADLILYRLQTDPGLPLTPLADSVPVYGTPVTMIGSGRARTGPKLYYNITVNSDTDWTWTPSTAAAYDLAGYAWGSPAGQLWAKSTLDYYDPTTQEVQGYYADDPFGFGKVRLITTTFTDTANSGNGAAGDSGGALFDDAGRLIGIADLISGYPSQPADTSIYGVGTYFLDLSMYVPQINIVIGRAPLIPEPSCLWGFAVAAVGLRRRAR